MFVLQGPRTGGGGMDAMADLTIPYQYVPNVLFLGNGLNRAFDSKNSVSWDDEVCHHTDLSEEEKVSARHAPYPLQAVIFSNDHVELKKKEDAPGLANLPVPDQEAELIRKYLSLGFDAVLTTDYSYEAEKSVDARFHLEVGRSSRYRRATTAEKNKWKRRGLYQYYMVEGTDKVMAPPIWHIHGEAALPDSMVLGHYDYGKIQSAIQEYITTFERRWNGASRYGKDFIVNSWIDYFMTGNVYMVGYGLDLSEFDIWWLINCKKRHNPNGSRIIWLEPEIDITSRLLAGAYGMMTPDIDMTDVNLDKTDGEENEQWFQVYHERAFAYIQDCMAGESRA